MVPIVFMHPEGSVFWSDWHQYNVDRLLQRGMISPEDLSLYKVTSSVEEAADEVRGFYRRYHSMRYVRDRLIVRLEAAISEEEIELLNEEFGDILKSGKIEPTLALAEEHDKTISHLPRIKFHFRRRAFGRLRELINRLNSFELPEYSSIEVPEAGEGGLLPSEMDEGSDN